VTIDGSVETGAVPAELFWLALTGVLVFVQMLLASSARAMAFGFDWAAGPRDDTPGEVSPRAMRLDRAYRNILETFPIFAVAAIGVVVAGISSPVTVLGAQIYFFGRLAYVPAYVFHVPMLRSLVWIAALAGLGMVIVPLLVAGLPAAFP